MTIPRFALVEQRFPSRRIPDIPAHIHQELGNADFIGRVSPGAQIAIGVGSRGISNLAAIVKSVVEFWKERDARPFLFPAMGSHGAATAEGQADVLAHYGIDESTMGAPVVSSLDVVSLGKTKEGIEVFVDKNAYQSAAVFLVGRVKWHTDFSGAIESGLCKMMAIGLGKLAGAQQYHTFAYRMGLEQVIRTVGVKVLETGKVLGGLAVLEGARHETAGLVAVSSAKGASAMLKHEEELLRTVKSWMGRLPAPEIDILIVDEIGKNISGAGMDTKVINRSVQAQYNPFPDTPIIQRIYARGLTSNTYGNGVGLGMADIVHDRLLAGIDWHPTALNSLTASTPSAIRTPVHFPTDRECLEKIAPTVGKIDLRTVTYCRIRNTLELQQAWVSDTLIPHLSPLAHVLSDLIEAPFDSAGNMEDFSNQLPENRRPLAASYH